MIQLTHNGVRSELDPGVGLSVAAVLRARAGADAPACPSEVVVRLSLDGRAVTEEELEDALAQPVAGVREIEVETRPSAEIAREGLDSATAYALAVGSALCRAAEAFQTGRLADGNRLLAEGLDALSVLLLGVELVARELGEAGREIGGIEQAFQPPLAALLAAHGVSDWVRVADVLEHEVAASVESWRCRLETVRASAPGGLAR